MKLNGYEISFSDGSKVKFAPHDPSKPTVLEQNGMRFSVRDGQFFIEDVSWVDDTFRVSEITSIIKASFDITVDSDSDRQTSDIGIRRNCAGSCCITNGCAVCGGGWICDLR